MYTTIFVGGGGGGGKSGASIRIQNLLFLLMYPEGLLVLYYIMMSKEDNKLTSAFDLWFNGCTKYILLSCNSSETVFACY